MSGARVLTPQNSDERFLEKRFNYKLLYRITVTQNAGIKRA